MRIADGSVPLWPYHWKRLVQGARALGMEIHQETLEQELAQALALAPQDGILKLIVTAASGERGYRVTRPLTINRVLQWYSRSEAKKPEAVRLQCCDYRLSSNRVLAGIKHLNRLDQVMAAEEVRDDCQGLLLDAEGHLIEALSHNLFLRLDQRWLTPSLDYAGVAGVMRAVLLKEVFPALGLQVTEAVLPLNELYRADEIFICNSIQGVVPVAEEVVSGKSWACHLETSRIQQTLKELYPCFIA